MRVREAWCEAVLSTTPCELRRCQPAPWTLPAFFLAFSFIVWVSQSMLFLQPLRRRRAKPVFSFSSFFFVFGLSLRSLVRSKSCAGESWDIPAACRYSRAFTAYSRSAAHWARRDCGKSNSYTFWPHRRPAWPHYALTTYSFPDLSHSSTTLTQHHTTHSPRTHSQTFRTPRLHSLNTTLPTHHVLIPRPFALLDYTHSTPHYPLTTFSFQSLDRSCFKRRISFCISDTASMIGPAPTRKRTSSKILNTLTLSNGSLGKEREKSTHRSQSWDQRHPPRCLRARERSTEHRQAHKKQQIKIRRLPQFSVFVSHYHSRYSVVLLLIITCSSSPYPSTFLSPF